MTNKRDPFEVLAKYVFVLPGLAAERFVLTQLEKLDIVIEKADDVANTLIDKVKYPK